MEIRVWNSLLDKEREELLTRPAQTSGAKVQAIVENIIDRIRKEGDVALKQFSKELDHYEGDSLELSEEEKQAAISRLSPELKQP